MAAEQQRIDDLLQRYLGLLDEYMRLRGSLSGTQAQVYQEIARANFSAERGLRFGQDHYDARMRATRLLRIRKDDDDAAADVPVFTVVADASATAPAAEAPVADDEKPLEQGVDRREGHGEQRGQTPQTPQTARDPLRWFGLFAPAALRKAQSLSIEMVEQAVPRLASVDAEMRSVEMEVRRARKRRAKGVAAEKKQAAEVTQRTEAQLVRETVETS